MKEKFQTAGCHSLIKGNCDGKFLLLLFAFLSSHRSISKCGKISKLLVKYGQSFYNTSCCGRGLFMTQIRERVHGGFYCNSVSWKVN